MNDSDEALFREYADGNEHALGRLLERHRDSVARLVYSYLGPRSPWAEDVAQDVFVQAQRVARSYQGRSSFKTWLYGIALNLCRDYRRRERTTRGHRAIEEIDDVLSALPDGSLDPLQRLERDELATLVRAAVARLAPAHRVVLQLRDGEGMSYDDIAHVLEVPVGTVRSRLHNARAALAQQLVDCEKVTDMDCRHAIERLSADLDGELSADETDALQRHLASCDGCSRKRALLETARWAYRTTALDPAPRLRRGIGRGLWLSAAAASAAVLVLVLFRGPATSPRPEAPMTSPVEPALDCGLPPPTKCVMWVDDSKVEGLADMRVTDRRVRSGPPRNLNFEK